MGKADVSSKWLLGEDLEWKMEGGRWMVESDTGISSARKFFEAWKEVALRESPWYQEIVQEGFQKGRQEGLVEGVLSVLQSRFELPSSAVERLTLQLQQVDDVEVLRRLLVTAATAERLDQFQTALERADGFTDDGTNSEDRSTGPAHP